MLECACKGIGEATPGQHSFTKVLVNYPSQLGYHTYVLQCTLQTHLFKKMCCKGKRKIKNTSPSSPHIINMVHTITLSPHAHASSASSSSSQKCWCMVCIQAKKLKEIIKLCFWPLPLFLLLLLPFLVYRYFLAFLLSASSGHGRESRQSTAWQWLRDLGKAF